MKNQVTCPMCLERFDVRNDLRVHIMCDHRKSAVVDDLLTVLETRQEPREQPEERQLVTVEP